MLTGGEGLVRYSLPIRNPEKLSDTPSGVFYSVLNKPYSTLINKFVFRLFNCFLIFATFIIVNEKSLTIFM